MGSTMVSKWCERILSIHSSDGSPIFTVLRAFGTHFGVDEHPFATYFDVHPGFLWVLTRHVAVSPTSARGRVGRVARATGSRRPEARASCRAALDLGCAKGAVARLDALLWAGGARSSAMGAPIFGWAGGRNHVLKFFLLVGFRRNLALLDIFGIFLPGVLTKWK